MGLKLSSKLLFIWLHILYFTR